MKRMDEQTRKEEIRKLVTVCVIQEVRDEHYITVFPEGALYKSVYKF